MANFERLIGNLPWNRRLGPGLCVIALTSTRRDEFGDLLLEEYANMVISDFESVCQDCKWLGRKTSYPYLTKPYNYAIDHWKEFYNEYFEELREFANEYGLTCDVFFEEWFSKLAEKLTPYEPRGWQPPNSGPSNGYE